MQTCILGPSWYLLRCSRSEKSVPKERSMQSQLRNCSLNQKYQSRDLSHAFLRISQSSMLGVPYFSDNAMEPADTMPHGPFPAPRPAAIPLVALMSSGSA